MHHLWVWFVTAVWPNLLASLIWAVPAFMWHHRRVAGMVSRLHRQVDHLHDKVDGIHERG